MTILKSSIGIKLYFWPENESGLERRKADITLFTRFSLIKQVQVLIM